MGRGIATELNALATDEGSGQAVHVAQQWYNALEAMAEVANAEQLAAVRVLIEPLKMVFAVHVDATPAERRAYGRPENA